MTLALTGATGFVGSTLIEIAVEAGVGLKALTRREQRAQASVEWVAGDLGNKEALRRLVRGSEAVLHVAGVVNAPDPAGFEAGNVTGTLNLIEACQAEGVRRFVFVSSLSAREPELSAYGASKARAEKVVIASGLDWTIVRPPAIYGPRDTEMFEMFRIARWGLMPMPPREGRMSVIHAADLVFQPWGTWAFRARAGFIRLFREHPSYGTSLGAAFDYPLTPTTALSLAYTWAEADMSTSVPGDPGKDPKDAFDGVSLVWRKRF